MRAPVPRAPAADPRPSSAPASPGARRTSRRCSGARTRACARPARRSRSSATRTRSSRTSSPTPTRWSPSSRRSKREVARWIREAGETAEITATPPRRAARRRSPGCPTFLDELSPTMARLGRAGRRADAAARRPPARRARPRHASSRASARSPRPRRPASTRSARPPRSARGRSRGAARRSPSCARSPTDAPPFAKPLRQFLETIDDRRRAIEDDPRAQGERAARARPDGDRAAPGGFTGMEAIWNYFFWQTLSINAFDDVGHILRVVADGRAGLHRRSATSRRSTRRDQRDVRDCNPWLGPNQPGITSPTRSTSADPQPRACARRRASRPTRLGERRGAGEPEAGPLPGQPDLSKPQVALPPALQDLLDSLTPSERRAAAARPDELAAQARSSCAARARTQVAPAAGAGSRSASGTDRPAPRLPPRAMSAAARNSLDRREPGPGRRGHRARRDRRGVPRLQREHGPAVRARPTTLKAELPSGAKLVEGNEVRVGGFRVGVVEEIEPSVGDGRRRAAQHRRRRT